MGVEIRNKKKRKPGKATKKKAVKYSNLPDLSNDPYFVKKADEARRFLVESGILKN